jgi:hypothetical protein
VAVAAAVAAADHGDRPSGPVFTTAGYPTASRPPTPGRSAQPGCAGQPKKIPGFGKDCSGLDQAQARLYHAIARHTVLVMAALAICAVTAALLRRRTDTAAPAPVLPDQPPPAEFGMIPLTVPETGRLLAHPPHQAAPRTGWTGGVATRPVHAGTTSAHDSRAMPQLSWSASEWPLPY